MDQTRGDENRAYWEKISEEYQGKHGDSLAEQALAWGVWRIPETDLKALGDMSGKDVLELGCGAAQWTTALSGLGTRAVGVDFSERQLTIARQRDDRACLVQGDAKALPFADASFDVVFCDHGAMSFTKPGCAVAEVARVLRHGGLFAFCMSTPLRDICSDSENHVVPALCARYFGLTELRDDSDSSVCYHLPYGDWIRLFRSNGFMVEDLIELQPNDSATTTYDDYVSLEWARNWPAEHIWKVRGGLISCALCAADRASQA